MTDGSAASRNPNKGWSIVVLCVIVAVLFVAVSRPSPASAQAAIPPQGAAWLDLSYQYYNGGDHLFSTDVIDGESTRGYVAHGNHWYLGDDQASTILGSLDIGIQRHVALTLGAAWVSSAYFGNAPIDPVVDDGQYHSTLQDGLVRLRSPFAAGSFLLTPFVGAAFPLRDYPVTGHSAPGRGLIEWQSGVYALHGLGSYASFGFISAEFGYGYVTNAPGYNLGRMVAAARVGYYRSRQVTIYAGGHLLDTFGGLEWASSDPTAPTAHGAAGGTTLHNQISASRSVLVGLGMEWGISSRLSLHADVDTTVWGENVEGALVIDAGVAWLFRMFGQSPVSGIPVPNQD